MNTHYKVDRNSNYFIQLSKFVKLCWLSSILIVANEFVNPFHTLMCILKKDSHITYLLDSNIFFFFTCPNKAVQRSLPSHMTDVSLNIYILIIQRWGEVTYKYISYTYNGFGLVFSLIDLMPINLRQWKIKMLLFVVW